MIVFILSSCLFRLFLILWDYLPGTGARSRQSSCRNVRGLWGRSCHDGTSTRLSGVDAWLGYMERLCRCILLVCSTSILANIGNSSTSTCCIEQWTGKENITVPAGCMVAYGNRSRLNCDLRDMPQFMAQSKISRTFYFGRFCFCMQGYWSFQETLHNERRRNTTTWAYSFRSSAGET